MSERLLRIERVAAALVVAGLAAAFAWGASGLRGDVGRFPLLVGTITAVLALAEAAVRALAAPPPAAPEPAGPASRRRAALLLAWFAGTLAGLWLIGVVAGTALWASIYFRLFAGLRLLPALAAGAGLAGAFHVGFGLLAGLRLHSGLWPMPWP
ncbi:MAG: hypothetical protein ACK4TB_11900 [Gemmobacter sp.]